MDLAAVAPRKPDEVERLEKQIRELKATNRSLERRLKKLNKGYYKIRDEGKIEEKDIPKEVKICYSCRVGHLQLIDLGSRYYRQCNECKYHTKSKLKMRK